MRRYVVSVDRALLDHTPTGADAEPVRVEDTKTGRVESYCRALLSDAIITYGAPRQDGTRVWIEAVDVVGEKLP
jgi:hypothetical protein